MLDEGFDPLRFVIADDSAIPRDILHRVIRNAGYEVVGIASTGEEAVALCRKHRPDVAVLDVSMPGKFQGTIAAKMIVEESLAKHVIMASSASQDVVVNQMTDIGVSFVAKPYNKEIFLKKLQLVLNAE